MTTLKNHTLLYDTDCPLCAAYTKGFINAGIIEETGRLSYEKGIAQYSDLLDTDRARNEIALVNTNSGMVLYGIESMNYIITHKFPLLKPVLNNVVILFLLRKFYSFISFNRKVIAASVNYPRQTCVPDFNLAYRVFYLVLSAVFTSTILKNYSFLLKGFIPGSTMAREYLICFGQIIFQGSILLVIKTGKEKVFDYLGHMMTVSLIGGLLLLPMIILDHYINLPGSACLSWFFAVVCFMFLQRQKRVRYIHAPVFLSCTWVLYRCLVLLLIL